MRKELELIEQIENYLMNKLSGAEKATFEAKINANPGLKTDVEFQQNLMEGIQRMGLKNDAINARKKFRIQRFFKATGITLLIITAIATASYYIVNATNADSNETSEKTEQPSEILPIIIPENDSLSTAANAYLDQQLFEIKTDRDTVIETEGGIVVFIPANAFETENTQVDFLIQEALTPADILYAGLNTMTAEGEELETGGMFYFDAFDYGKRIPLVKELTVDIPSNPDKTGMQLYDGVKDENNEILWTNPKPFRKPLIPVEITELDFYPRGYEPKMNEWGYLNKEFKDSLYYSFADECGVTVPSGLSLPQVVEDTSDGDIEVFPEGINTRNVSTGNPMLMLMPLPQMEELQSLVDSTSASDDLLNDDIRLGNNFDCIECGVNPASVKTIWNSKFNNTNLATKTFEERMPFIHQTCNNSILELYINNLDKNLCTVDSMAMRMLGGTNRNIFANFAAKGQGKVELATNAQQKLNAYYALKKTALQMAITKTNADYWANEQAVNAELAEKKREARNRDSVNNTELSRKELEFNTNNVYAKLGMEKPIPRSVNPVNFNANLSFTPIAFDEVTVRPNRPIRPNRQFLRANINSTGWKNVDCLMAVSTAREDAQIRGYNGLVTSINYSTMNLRVNNAAKYDRINVYVIPKKFNSYVKLQATNGEYNYELNDKLTYSAIAIAWNSDGMFYGSIPVTKGLSALQLLPITKTEWEGKIKSSLGNINNMSDELDYLQYAKKAHDLQNTNASKRNLRNKARPFVFPCKCNEGDAKELPYIENNNPISQPNTLNVNELDIPGMTMQFPTAFTPDGDGLNEFFRGTITNVQTFSIIITDQAGNEVFKSTNPNFRWDGTNGAGQVYGDDKYTFVASATNASGQSYTQRGFVTLIRGE